MKTKEIHTKEFWDARSELWVKDFNCKSSRQENEDRYQYTDDFLVAQGLYNGNSEILDIGCGPGMFTARFAEKARSVTGLDISGKMVEYARQNTEQSGLNNVSFINIPWEDIDLKYYGMEKAYDLVFASLCPGISGEENLLKMSLASWGWCFTCSFARKVSSLKNNVYQHILGVPFDSEWGKNSISKSVDCLLTAGYYPYITYYDTSAQLEWQVNEKTAAHFAGHLGPLSKERENIDKYTTEVLNYLKNIAVNDIILDDTQARIAFLYWQTA